MFRDLKILNKLDDNPRPAWGEFFLKHIVLKYYK